MFIYVSLTVKELLLVRSSVVVVDKVAGVGTFRPNFFAAYGDFSETSPTQIRLNVDPLFCLPGDEISRRRRGRCSLYPFIWKLAHHIPYMGI